MTIHQLVESFPCARLPIYLEQMLQRIMKGLLIQVELIGVPSDLVFMLLLHLFVCDLLGANLFLSIPRLQVACVLSECLL